METERLRAIIVDDEPLSRERIRGLLEDHPTIEVVAECEDGQQAIEMIADFAPDLVFLDIQMPGTTGLQVVASVGAEAMPVVVFVTAYDEYAVPAFDANAIDYLLKPVERERFARAVERASLRVQQRNAGIENVRLGRLIAALPDRGGAYPDRIVVRTGTRLTLVSVRDIDWIEAEGNYARLHVGAASHLLRERMSDLERRLDPRRHMRIHRSTIVNVDRVFQLESLFRGEYLLILKDGTRLTSSRSYRPNVQAILGADPG